MNMILKYSLNTNTEQEVILPKGAKILSVQPKDGILTMWAMTPRQPSYPVKRKIRIYATGQYIDDTNLAYIGTAQVGIYVWHVFEESIGEYCERQTSSGL